jgi:hypothetical protein
MPHDYFGRPTTAVEDIASTGSSRRAQSADVDGFERVGAVERDQLPWYEQLGFSALFPNDYDDLECEF